MSLAASVWERQVIMIDCQAQVYYISHCNGYDGTVPGHLRCRHWDGPHKHSLKRVGYF